MGASTTKILSREERALEEFQELITGLRGAGIRAATFSSLFMPVDKENIKEDWPELEGNIEFKEVSFAYNPQEPVLTNFNLKVKAGQTIALVGETGSGKSTIANLVCRFYEPNSGQILIDGLDYRERPLSWLQENLGYVLQSPHLFSGTIAENIRYGNLEASNEEIEVSAKMVNAHDFITKLPDGYQTEVGEGGGLLSTG